MAQPLKDLTATRLVAKEALAQLSQVLADTDTLDSCLSNLNDPEMRGLTVQALTHSKKKIHDSVLPVLLRRLVNAVCGR